MKGGYVLVNAVGVDLNEETATVTGIFQKFTAALNTGKLIIIENIVNDEAALSPVLGCAYVDDGDIVVTLSNGATLTITNEDGVTVS